MNSEIVTDFLAAWDALDLEAILSFFTEDAVYTNIPMGPPNTGIEEIRDFVSGILKLVSKGEFRVHHQVEGANGIVMNERTDILHFGPDEVVLPVMGIFELRDGKICAWRDYFDMAPLPDLGI